MIDYLILYEHKAREIESIILIKMEMERRGYEVDVINIHELNRLKYRFWRKPRVLVTPALYNNISFNDHVTKFVGKINKVVNLQWEQVLSDYWEKIGHHNPKENAIYPLHLCWGNAANNRLIISGAKQVIVTGPVHLDYLRREFENYYLSKQNLLDRYNIEHDKKIILYISSFTLASMSQEEINKMSNHIGADMVPFYSSMLESKEMTLKWIEKLLEENRDLVFIYRPHPNENSDEKLEQLSIKYNNFKIIGEYSVKQWILVADKIFTWISTSIVDSFFANKYCGILRPIHFSTDLEPVIYKNAQHITSYSEFIEMINNQYEVEFPIDKDLILDHYDFDDLPSYIRVSNILETVLNTTKFDVSNNDLEVKNGLSYLVVPILKKILLSINCISNNTFRKYTKRIKRLDEFYKSRTKQKKEIYSRKEIEELTLKLSRVVNQNE